MHSLFRMTLTRRVIGLTILGLIFTSLLILDRSKSVLEEVLLDQSKQQALVFLRGIEAEVLKLDDPLNRDKLQAIIDSTMERDHLSQFSFRIFQLYIFDQNGIILANSLPKERKPKELQEHYAELFNRGASFLGEKVEYAKHPVTGEIIPKADIIIPLHYQGEVVAALEVEIDLEQTLDKVKQLDDTYEQEIILIVIGCLLLGLFFIWFVVDRWMVSPIRAMVNVTEHIADGVLGKRVDAISEDELGQLSHSINRMAESIENLFTEQEEAHMEMLHSLAKALETKDAYTASHSGRVAHYSVKLGKRIGLSERELTLLKQGALMHDLGKIGIPDAILNKPGKLEEQEYEVIQHHPEMTSTIMLPMKRFKEFGEIAAWHHERWDGHGYPDGLKGAEIPLLARIVAIADTWDAMTGDRVYREGMSAEQAISILLEEQYSGQWDPELISHFIEMIKGKESARVDIQHDMFD